MGFWTRKRVVVTGGAGFLGSFVVEKLRSLGCPEMVIPRSHHYDLRNIEAIRELLRVAKPDIVIHLAAQVGGIGANLTHQSEFFYDNLMMGAQLLHEARQFGVEKFVTVGTVCSYPKFTPVPFRESDFWNGYPEETNAPYGLAKKMLLVQSQVYRQQYAFNAVYLIPTNLYGPRDNFDLESSHVIPALIRKFLAANANGNNHVTVWGSGRPTREFLYVEDAAEGIVKAAERYNGPEPVNLGSGSEVSIEELARLIARLTGFKGEIRWDSRRPDGQPRRSLDITKAKELFGFSARVDLENGLRRTIEWFLKSPGALFDRR